MCGDAAGCNRDCFCEGSGVARSTTEACEGGSFVFGAGGSRKGGTPLEAEDEFFATSADGVLAVEDAVPFTRFGETPTPRRECGGLLGGERPFSRSRLDRLAGTCWASG